MTRNLLPAVVGALMSLNSFAADSYLCVADITTGLSYDKSAKKWKSVDFRSEKKLFITRVKHKSYAWEVKEAGDRFPGATCKSDFNDAGNLFCSGVFDFRFNSKKLRFLYVYPLGYWSDDNSSGVLKEGENTPALAIGKCNPA